MDKHSIMEDPDVDVSGFEKWGTSIVQETEALYDARGSRYVAEVYSSHRAELQEEMHATLNTVLGTAPAQS